MAKQNEHGRLIAAAAEVALAPLNCRRIGQSRSWISDQRSWVIMIEFQPSAWEKGTYLNVWPQWLWLRLGAGHMNLRVGDFIAFKSAEQFTPLVEDLAAQAAQRVVELRNEFRTLCHISRFLTGRINDNCFRIYAAAVTAGLAGDTAAARRLFNRIQMLDVGNYAPWIEVQTESAMLAAVLDEPAQYRATALATIEEFRRRLRLLPDPQCLEAMDPIIAGQ
jgi:hypothetical protein